jgi:hypothetical protein
MHTEAQNLQFGDTVVFEGETYHVIESKLNPENGYYHVYLSPTDGIGLDRIFAFPPTFNFWKISSIDKM